VIKRFIIAAIALKHLATLERADACTATRRWFMKLVKARAVTAVCMSGLERERTLGRFDTDVERINKSNADNCR
jgi:hypothetical protein